MSLRSALLAALLLPLSAAAGPTGPAPYQDPAQPLAVRVHDLLSRLTLDEKAGLMKNASDGVPRLGIPNYDWWNEGLHGVARAGVATVFPQAIGLAATWNPSLMRRVADAISTEARAKYEEARRQGRAGERYRGLTFWSPNINLVRDPRWGRGQETYGEDPYLTARIGVAYVRGLQGNDPLHLKTAACAKHFAAYSGPEPGRYHFDVEPTAYDLHETYLPAFEALVRDGHVAGVMTAYNALDGTPCTANRMLFGLLRRWGFDGYAVSDCGAVYCLYDKYGIAHNYPEAEAMAVKAGLNLRCGDGAAQLAIAVRRGLLTEAQLDAGLVPLLRTRFRLGMFDPPGTGPYANIPVSANHSPAHAALALEAARQSIVLLRNDGTLPLDRTKLRRVLVTGPNADSVPALLGNYHGTPAAPVTILAGVRAALEPAVAVDYAPGCGYAALKTGATIVPDTALDPACRCPDAEETTGLHGAYFANPDLAGKPAVVRRDPRIAFTWHDRAPAPGVPAGTFSVRWTGTLTPGLAGAYHFTLSAAGGVRLYLDHELVVDAWTATAPTQTREFTRRFAEGAVARLRVEYTHPAGAGPAAVTLRWTPPPPDSGFADALSRARSADAVIFVGGLSPRLENEDMPVDYRGFSGGDRTRIELPPVQQRFLAALVATGKPVVFVNLSGSAVAWPALAGRVDAIVQAWYPGQAGGTAVADVLFGRADPAGRLPVTFYRSTEELPPFTDYDMEGRTYRYFHGRALYPFGYGLSYARFAYAGLRVVRDAGGGLVATVDVANTGARAGDEVVQLYLRAPAGVHPRAIESLAAFRRIHLAPGMHRTVRLRVAPASLQRWSNPQKAMITPAGAWEVLVGASSADIRQRATVRLD